MAKKQGFHSSTQKPQPLRLEVFSHTFTCQLFYEHKKVKNNKASRKTEDYRFTRDDLKKMADIGNLTKQYVITVGKSLGLRVSDFITLTRGNLEPYLNRELPSCIGPLNTQKDCACLNKHFFIAIFMIVSLELISPWATYNFII